MKVVYVTPRYGEEVVGGAEHAARMLAERVHDQLGWDVEVFTSCALDATTWEDHYPPETVAVNGVKVHRFAVTQPRDPQFPKTSERVHANPKLAPMSDQYSWVDQQGPHIPVVLEALAASDADLFIFYPYLYYPTVRGLPRVADRSVMHPAAHDEIPIQMSVYAPVFAHTKGFVFQTDGERRLVEDLFPIAGRPQITLGLGVDPQDGDEAGFRVTAGIGNRPYIVCVGRVDDGKGARLLARYFTEYKRRHPGDLTLVFVGPVIDRPDPHDDIIVTGPVSESHKWGALHGAKFLVSPSPFEAFSLVLIEAWSAGVPALVNAACLATREHAQRSGGGLWFDGYLSFEAAFARLLDDKGTADALAAAGKQYVDQHYRWPELITRYGKFLEHLAMPDERLAEGTTKESTGAIARRLAQRAMPDERLAEGTTKESTGAIARRLAQRAMPDERLAEETTKME